MLAASVSQNQEIERTRTGFGFAKRRSTSYLRGCASGRTVRTATK